MSAYESEIMCAFVDAHLEDEPPQEFDRRRKRATRMLNGRRLTISHRNMLARWAAKPTVSLEKVDGFLHQYGLMTWELEDWAERTYGRDGWLGDREPVTALAASAAGVSDAGAEHGVVGLSLV